MVSRLTFNFISLCQPFLLEPFRLGILANRTVPLFFNRSVNLIKYMTILTSLLGFIYSTDRLGVFHSVLQGCYLSQMLRINTVPITTGMVYDHTIRNLTEKCVVSNPMRSSRFSSKVERAITIFIEVASPKNAITLFRGKISKPLIFPYCKYFHVGNCTPYSSIQQYV